MDSFFKKMLAWIRSLRLDHVFRPVWERITRTVLKIFASVKKHWLPVCSVSAAAVVAVVLICVLSAGDDDGVVAISGSRNIASAGQPTTTPVQTLTHTPVPTEIPTPTPEPLHLGYGDQNDIVAGVQERLMALNYMDYDEPTDFYGSATSEAVRLFQRRNGLDTTGELDQAGYDLLMSDSALIYMAMLGDEGTDVIEMQTRLYELEYIDAITGYFGEKTEAAVKLFQEKNGLTVDGKVGRITKEKLYSDDAVPNSLQYGSKGDEVLKYQNRLSTLGYLTTEPDGIYGNDTVMAVKRFQERNALVVDGYLGPTTKQLLMSGDAKANKLEYTMSGDDITRVQYRLHELNYLHASSVTGYFGAVTDAAVRMFQSNNGLSVDGKVGKATMKKLFSDDPVRAAAYVTQGTPGLGDGEGGNIETFIAIAESKLGAPYVRGAKGPNAFDCSGFVYWCLNQAGVHQSYMTTYMWRTTNRYPRIHSMSDLRRGDIILFKMGDTTGHIGIVLGDNMMIDASNNRGQVVIRSYDTAFWRRTFFCGYRVFGG